MENLFQIILRLQLSIKQRVRQAAHSPRELPQQIRQELKPQEVPKLQVACQEKQAVLTQRKLEPLNNNNSLQGRLNRKISLELKLILKRRPRLKMQRETLFPKKMPKVIQSKEPYRNLLQKNYQHPRHPSPLQNPLKKIECQKNLHQL